MQLERKRGDFLKFLDMKLSEEQLRSVGMRGVAGTTIVGQAEYVKRLIDGTGLLAAQEGLNRLLDFLESEAAAANIAAAALFYGDQSEGTLQAKLLKLKQMLDATNKAMADLALDPRVIPYGSITADKLSPNICFDGGGYGDEGEPVDDYNPYDFSYIGYGLDAMRRVVLPNG